MSALTLRLPDDKHARLRALAKSRGTTVNRLLDEAATLLISEFDAETRFRLRAGTRRRPGRAWARAAGARRRAKAAEVDGAVGPDAQANVGRAGGAAIIVGIPPP
jgi:predicted DNA-binding protein